MDITKSVVIQWLDEQRRSHGWLADQLVVSKQAVSNYLSENSQRQIPAEHQITIARLMAEDAAASVAKPPHSLVLEFGDADYENIEHAALRSSKTIREWAKNTLLEIANENIEALAAMLKGSLPPTVNKSLTVDLPQIMEIPLLRAAAGSPILADAEMIEVDRDYGVGRFMLELRGDSMDPHFRDRQRVILRDIASLKRPLLKYGELYAFVVDGAITFKQWAKDKGVRKVLHSFNPEYPDLPMDENTTWIGWYDPNDNTLGATTKQPR